MRELLELIRNAASDSCVAFRDRVYRRGDQGELLRDVVALANADVVGRRFLFMGVADRERGRSFPGISARSWKSFSEALPDFLARAEC